MSYSGRKPRFAPPVGQEQTSEAAVGRTGQLNTGKTEHISD